MKLIIFSFLRDIRHALKVGWTSWIFLRSQLPGLTGFVSAPEAYCSVQVMLASLLIVMISRVMFSVSNASTITNCYNVMSNVQ